MDMQCLLFTVFMQWIPWSVLSSKTLVFLCFRSILWWVHSVCAEGRGVELFSWLPRPLAVWCPGPLAPVARPIVMPWAYSCLKHLAYWSKNANYFRYYARKCQVISEHNMQYSNLLFQLYSMWKLAIDYSQRDRRFTIATQFYNEGIKLFFMLCFYHLHNCHHYKYIIYIFICIYYLFKMYIHSRPVMILDFHFVVIVCSDIFTISLMTK